MGLLYLYLLTLEYGVKVQMIIHKQSNVGEIWGDYTHCLCNIIKFYLPELENHVTKKMGKYLQQFKIDSLLGFTNIYLIYSL